LLNITKNRKKVLGVKKKSIFIYMIRTLFLLALMAAFSFATPVSDHGKLSVKDGKIVDKDGKPFVLRGMSMFWNIWDVGSKFYNENTVKTIANDWKGNVVRVAIGNTSVSDATNFMDWTASAGIYVLVDWHHHDMEQSNAESFFTSVASHAKTKGYNHVIYEIFNEPCAGGGNNGCSGNYTWAQIKSYAEAVIGKIRAQDSDGLIVVGTPGLSTDPGVAPARANPITGDKAKNVLYTQHVYTSDPYHNTLQTNIKTSYCSNFPIFITEMGISEANGDGQLNWTLTNNWMSLIESAGISWANWSIVDKGESSSAISGGSLSNLSTSGKYITTIMKARNGGGSITSANGSNNVTLTQVNLDCGSAAQEGVKTGIVKIGTSTTNAVDFVPNSMSGAKDSVVLNSVPILQNSSNTFKVGYKLTEIPGAGQYRLRLRYGSTAAVTVSWAGDGVESGSFELPSTGKLETWKNSDYIPLTIKASGSETPLNLTFEAKGANNIVFVNIQVSVDPNGGGTSSSTPASSSSSKESSSSTTTPIASPQPAFSNSLTAMQNSINLQVAREATFKVFDLKGNMVRSLNFTQGSHTVSLGDLSKGLYIVKAQFGSQSEILRVPVR